jgi:hypothetical protein
MRTLEDRATAVLSYVTVGAEEKAIIRAQQAEIAKLRAALKQIWLGAENQNIDHKEFRVKARQCADAALGHEQIGKSDQ